MAREHEKILVIARPSIGDVLMTTPLIRALRGRWPRARLDVLLYAGQEGILDGNPDVDAVIPVRKHPSFAEYRAQLRRMGRHYDLGVSVSSSDRALLYLLACARTRVSVVPPRGAWKRWICAHWLEAEPVGTHTLAQNDRLGRLVGVEPGHAVVAPRSADAADVLARVLGDAWERRPYAVLHLTPGHPYKRWRLDGWRDLALALRARGLRVVLTGGDGAEEREYLDDARSLLPADVESVAGRLRLGDLTLLLERGALFAGPDTVATHLAAGVGAPTVAVFGPTNPLKWAPWPHGHRGLQPPFWKKGSQRVRNVFLVQGPGGCVPCQQLGCERQRASRADCLDALPSSAVVAAALEMLASAARGAQASST
jgi:heptosyltransferase III